MVYVVDYFVAFHGYGEVQLKHVYQVELCSRATVNEEITMDINGIPKLILLGNVLII